MRKEYDLSKMKVKRNPYAGSLWKAIFRQMGSIVKRAGLTEKDVAGAISSYRKRPIRTQ